MVHYDAAGVEWKSAITDKNKLFVAPVNNLLHSLFRQVVLTLNNKQVNQNTQNYAYVSYWQQLMAYENIAAAQHIAGVCFHLDTPKHFDSIVDNEGAVKRGMMFQPGEEVCIS